MTAKTGNQSVWSKAARGLRTAVVGMALASPFGHAAAADTAYGCSDLLTSDLVPSLEGTGGTFFRIFPDLQSFHWLGAETVALLSELSEALAADGTTLIYLPVPTKAMAMPDALPSRAADLGYDADIAASVYGEMLDQLRGAGVQVLDARRVLRRVATSGRAPFLGPDPRLSPDGVEALAQALSAEIDALGVTPGPADGNIRLSGAGEADLPSTTRQLLQTHCVGNLPELRLPVLDAVQGAGQDPAVGPAVTFSGVASAPIVVIGTEIAVDPALNLSEHLASYTTSRVASYMVPGEDRRGDALAALSSYLTAPGAEDARPEVLIWANPVWINPARFGSRPLQEVIAAVRGGCSTQLALTDLGPGIYRAALDGGGAGDALMLDTDGGDVRRVELRFVLDNASLHRRTIERHPDQIATGRFLMPMDAMDAGRVTSIEVAFAAREGAVPRLFMCGGLE